MTTAAKVRQEAESRDFCFWPLADICAGNGDVRYQG
jgi:hypothetical protein